MPLITDDAHRSSVDELLRTRAAVPRAVGRTPARLPAPAGGLTPLEEAQRGRRSVREFSKEPLPAQAVDAVLTRALGAAPGTVERGISIFLAARRVAGTAPGFYAWGTAEPLGNVPAECVDEYADAPVLLFLSAAVGKAPAHAYGGLLSWAGALGYAVWMAARTHGFDCSVYGLPHFRVNAAMRRQKPHLCHLFTVALGRRGDSRHGGEQRG